jgi:hypothetical protein
MIYATLRGGYLVGGFNNKVNRTGYGPCSDLQAREGG